VFSPPPTPAPAGENSFELEGRRPSDPAGEADESRSDESSQNPSGWFVASACTAAPRGTPSSLLQFGFSADFVLLFAFVAHILRYPGSRHYLGAFELGGVARYVTGVLVFFSLALSLKLGGLNRYGLREASMATRRSRLA